MIDLTEIDKQVRFLLFCTSFSLLKYGFCSNLYVRQNIDADLGRVIAKVSNQISSPPSVKDQDKKKRKKEKKPSGEDNKEPHNDAAPNTSVGAPDIVEGPATSRDNKKKKKLMKAHSNSTTTAPDDSISGKPPGESQDAINTTQNPPLDKIFEQHNESSNSCMQPPPVKVSSNTFFLCRYDF
jgi:hypothetical protein